MKRSLLVGLMLAGTVPGREAAAAPDCVFDNACRPAVALPTVAGPAGEARKALALAAAVPVAPKPRQEALPVRTVKGAGKGFVTGFEAAFIATMIPAVALLSEGFSRRMSRHYDGPKPGNRAGGFFTWAGIAVGVVTYIPALALGLAGGVIGTVVGAAAEAVAPGSTKRWNADALLD